MALKAITQALPEIIEVSKQLMSSRADIYIASGVFDDDEIPTSYSEFKTLFTGETAKFKKFGAQEEEGSEIEIKSNPFNYFKGQMHKDYSIKASIKLHTFTEAMLAFVDSADFQSKVSVLIVEESTPETADVSADNPANFFALSGINLIYEGKGKTNGDQPSQVFTSENKAKKLTQIVKFKQFTTAT